MSIENIAVFAVPFISLLALWGANIISNRPKREDTLHKRIETVIQSLEKDIDRKSKQLDDCEARCSKTGEENRRLREDKRYYKSRLSEVEKGGE